MNKPLFKDLESRVDRCMIRDRFRFRRELREKGARASLLKKIEASIALVEERRAVVPVPEFPETLPISNRVDDIRAALESSQVVVVAGETGSGKTTQLPKVCLSMGRGVSGMIGHTQPRRVAARTVAARIAEELGVRAGEEVGYQIRFNDTSSPGTLVKVMTDGIMLAETAHDRFLERYDTLIIDEAHERSLNIDFLLGYIKRILPKRPDLKVIITSATIDVMRFSEHFGNAPVIEVSGRTWPVEVIYRPLAETGRGDDQDELMVQGILDVLNEIVRLEKHRKGKAGHHHGAGNGDVLVFLSGEREIREVAQSIRKAGFGQFEVLPLYSRLGSGEQNRVFAPHTGRRIVLATNVAETSLTVPGIRYVIDPGMARISRYSYRSKIQRLPVEPVSRASAEQRKGRCGRVSEGVCFRLYSEQDFESRPEFTQPEMMRTNLASVILQMLQLRLGDMAKFPFVERPEQRQINDGFHLLYEIGAVDRHRRITRQGRDIADFPIDLRFARMLLEAGRTGCLTEMLVITSALSVQDPRERPLEQAQAADEAHRTHEDERSDFLSLLNLWNHYEEMRQELSQRDLRQYCRKHYLSFPRMREWRDVHRQLCLLTREKGLRENRQPADYDSIHRALLSGLLGNIGEKTDTREYTGTRNRKHYIFPGSSQFARNPPWIVSAEIVETSRSYARNVARIDVRWIEPLAEHLIKRNCFEPHFDPERGQVMAWEEVRLYGLVIVRKRLVDFGSIDPVQAREIFIQQGLVSRELQSNAAFYRHNNDLIDEVLKLESKTRKRDILIDHIALYRFYDERLPANVVSRIELESFCRKAGGKSSRQLYLDKESLMKQRVELPRDLYPERLDIANASLRLDYHFDPMHEEDGVSVDVPVAILRQVSKAQIDWLIPGMLREKCLALIRSLPKSIRRNFVPAPEYADRIAGDLEFDGRELRSVLAERLFAMTGVRVPVDAFNDSGLDRHLRMNIRVVDENGKRLGSGRDLQRLVEEFSEQVDHSFDHAPTGDIEKTGLTDWNFGDLPEEVDIHLAGTCIKGYPALIDEGTSVSVRVEDNPVAARKKTEQGMLRLVMLQLREQKKYIEKNIPGFGRFSLYYATRGSREELLQHFVDAVFRYTFIEDKPYVGTESAFRKRLEEKRHLIVMMNRVAELVGESLRQVISIEERIKGRDEPAVTDIRSQLDVLFVPGFPDGVPLKWLAHYPRYLRAICYRLEKLRGNPEKDRQKQEEIAIHARRLSGLGEAQMDALEKYRWMLQEYRVSLFAQPEGTSMPVSARRLEKEWERSMAVAGQ